MTMVLSAVTHGIAVQVADRLVSLRRGTHLEALDRSANKLIAYVAKDAHVSIGYAGQAFIGNTPTDEFIAQTLTGVSFTRGENEMCGVRMGGGIPRYDIGLAIKKLAEALVASVRPNEIIQLAIIGHQFKPNRPVRPLFVRLELSSHGLQQVKRLPRNFPTGRAVLDGIGFSLDQRELADISASVFQDPNVTEPHHIASRLTGEIRKRAGPGVGPHTSVVILPFPGSAPIETGFFPLEPHYAILQGGGQDRSLIADISPWILAPGLIKPPSYEVGGGLTYHANGLEFVTKGAPEGPPTNGDGMVFAFSTMPRFKRPAHVR